MKTCGGRIYDKERHDEGKATARILSGVGFVKAGLCDGCAPIHSRRGGEGTLMGRFFMNGPCAATSDAPTRVGAVWSGVGMLASPLVGARFPGWAMQASPPRSTPPPPLRGRLPFLIIRVPSNVI